ncbi:hypothetical protein ABT236_38255 [Streptomyces sp. NPDC001523]|uniref:hypothetical protein n=1 Tax=Streptomyces sp. NPDC001523 TaxID=3154383 RepID=UPI003327F225
MADARETNARRLRRLTEMSRSRAVERAGKALSGVWTDGFQPSQVVLRTQLIQSADGPGPLARLVLPRGVAMRFYLLALFEARCRLRVGDAWTGGRPLAGVGSWSDFIAIDGAYDARSTTYMRDTRQGREGAADLRLRQIQSALKTLEELGPEQALVTVPRAATGGRRLYGKFSLMKETGRGDLQTPDVYMVPQNHWSARTITIPADFFLNGWVQLLNPSEVATWLILRTLSQWARDQHAETGVYLYGKQRLEDFGLRRDAWEDGCQRLRAFGLIRPARATPLDSKPAGIDFFGLFAQAEREQYEPYRWQVTDVGLAEDAVKVCTRELTIRQKQLDSAAKERAGRRGAPSAPTRLFSAG